MLKACIEIISTGESTWIEIPNGDLSSAISDFTGDRDWECINVFGLKKDGITNFTNNSLHECDIFELNNLILEWQDNNKIDYEDLAVLNLLLEDRNHNCEEVKDLIKNGNFYIYRNAEDMGDVAMEWLENNSSWYQEAKENEHFFNNYFDFKSYGEEVLEADGNWLKDKRNKIIVEVYE